MSYVTQYQVAVEAQVSRSTVQAVLSSDSRTHISPEVREHVLAVANRLNYRPNRYAQVMGKRKSGLIGIINFSPLTQLAELKALAAAETLIRGGRYEPLVQQSLWSDKTVDAGEETCRRMLDARVEGVIVASWSPAFQQKHVQRLLKAGVPVVELGQGRLQGFPKFYVDREEGYRQLAHHLLGLGYRRIALLAAFPDYMKRGMAQAVREYGVTVESGVCSPKLGPDAGTSGPFPILHSLTGLEGMKEILGWDSFPEAVLCSNDNVAHGALTACAEAGKSVPRDLALTGFDNLAGSQFGAAPFTTVAQPIAELAEQVVDCLADLIHSGQAPEHREVKIPGELIVRRSCGGFQRAPSQ